MQKRKLQVFVSSTFKDLIEERQTAVQAILEAGHIPAGMELFTAGDESQLKIIKRWIEESDVYMLLLGGRYGSIEPNSGKSYTQLEYEYAVKLKKPLFSLVISRDGLKDKIKKEALKDNPVEVSEIDNVDKFKKFQNSVGGHNKLIAPWTEYKDITISVFKCLTDIEWRYREDLKGWVKADDIDDRKSLSELARLSKENSELKSQLAEVNKEQKISGMEILDMIKFLQQNTIKMPEMVPYYIDEEAYEPQNSLELFMGLCRGSSFLGSDNLIGYVEFRFIMNLNLVTIDGIITEKNGVLLFLYIEQNNIEWFNNVRCNPIFVH
jgi:Domain of unknown function (DUF4062)